MIQFRRNPRLVLILLVGSIIALSGCSGATESSTDDDLGQASLVEPGEQSGGEQDSAATTTAEAGNADQAGELEEGEGAPSSQAPAGELETGTAIALSPAAEVPAGSEVAIPVDVSIDPASQGWSAADVRVEIDGPITHRLDLDVSSLSSGAAQQGSLTLDVGRPAADELTTGVVRVLLELLENETVVDARVSQMAVVADQQRIWMGFGSVGDLQRTRLDQLLADGEISQSDYDEAYAATLETVTGSVEVKDD